MDRLMHAARFQEYQEQPRLKMFLECIIEDVHCTKNVCFNTTNIGWCKKVATLLFRLSNLGYIPGRSDKKQKIFGSV